MEIRSEPDLIAFLFARLLPVQGDNAKIYIAGMLAGLEVAHQSKDIAQCILKSAHTDLNLKYQDEDLAGLIITGIKNLKG